MRPVFHISLLKKVKEKKIFSQPVPPWLTKGTKLQLQHVVMKEVKYLVEGSMQVLIQWEGLPN